MAARAEMDYTRGVESWPPIDLPPGLADALGRGEIRSILVARTEHVGDLLWTTPAFRALRTRFPGASITVLTTSYARGVLDGNPNVDAVATLDRDRKRGRLRERRERAAIEVLRANPIDLAIVLDRRFAANTALARAAGARFILHPAVPFSTAEAHRRGLHVLDANAALLAPLGCPPPEKRLDFFVSDAARAWAREFLEARGVAPGTPLLGVHAGCGALVLRGRRQTPEKRRRLWFADRYAEVLTRFARGTGGRVVLTGLAAERAEAAPIFDALGDAALDAMGRTSVARLGALIERSAVYVSPDTGPMHIAAALGTPLVALFGPSSPVVSGPAGDPRRIRVLRYPFPCSPCGGWVKATCTDNVCMRAIRKSDVTDAVEELLGLAGVPQARRARAAS